MAEEVAAEEAAHQGLSDVKLDVRSWLGEGGEGNAGLEERMAGALVMRLLQAYHKEAGEPFDDENEDSYWRLQGFVPGALVKALDQPTLKRLIKAYISLPFSGV
ncbi:aminoglycoside phosphotransferase [Micractinium conductrix]|uniref:Aminoglycoside phosphotransferase n=1 Tax=Micractinium conductrix TaxID=554055 RepID=A0A2P6VPG2_9CHLO|nr:aminoglycoside phosphotransferase [Micractinium conductrix]|eukprot:PSC75970.1 aminoglycoside phosphotransferase [Micractinium conductrix]